MTKQFLSAGLFVQPLVNTSLPNTAIGGEQKVNFTQSLPQALQAIIAQGSVYALLANKNQQGEIVLVKQGSYNDSNKSVTIVRGQSKYANGGTDNDTLIEFRGFTQDLYLDFSIISPFALQTLYDTLQGLLGYDSDILRNLLPPATQSQVGGVKTAYRNPSASSVLIQSVMPTDAPAHERLYKAVYGDNTDSQVNGDIDELEMIRVDELKKLVDWLSDNPNRLETLKTLINALIASPAKLNNIIN
jgi:hypothetical protein